MTYEMTLNDVSAGEKVRIKSVQVNGRIRRRLLDMGFIDGAEVTCLFCGLSGEPAAFLINSTVIALRKEEMCRIKALRTEERQPQAERYGCQAWV